MKKTCYIIITLKYFFMYCRTLKKTCEKSPVTINIDPLQQEAENQVFLKTCEKSPVTIKVDPLQQEAENQVYFF